MQTGSVLFKNSIFFAGRQGGNGLPVSFHQAVQIQVIFYSKMTSKEKSRPGFFHRLFLSCGKAHDFPSEKAKQKSILKLQDAWWLRGPDLNQRPSGYEPDELPDCSTPRYLLCALSGSR